MEYLKELKRKEAGRLALFIGLETGIFALLFLLMFLIGELEPEVFLGIGIMFAFIILVVVCAVLIPLFIMKAKNNKLIDAMPAGDKEEFLRELDSCPKLNGSAVTSKYLLIVMGMNHRLVPLSDVIWIYRSDEVGSPYGGKALMIATARKKRLSIVLGKKADGGEEQTFKSRIQELKPTIIWGYNANNERMFMSNLETMKQIVNGLQRN